MIDISKVTEAPNKLHVACLKYLMVSIEDYLACSTDAEDLNDDLEFVYDQLVLLEKRRKRLGIS